MPCGATCTGWLCRRPGAEMWSLAHRDFLSPSGWVGSSIPKKERKKEKDPKPPSPGPEWESSLGISEPLICVAVLFLCSPHFWILDIGYFNFCEGLAITWAWFRAHPLKKWYLQCFVKDAKKERSQIAAPCQNQTPGYTDPATESMIGGLLLNDTRKQLWNCTRYCPFSLSSSLVCFKTHCAILSCYGTSVSTSTSEGWFGLQSPGRFTCSRPFADAFRHNYELTGTVAEAEPPSCSRAVPRGRGGTFLVCSISVHCQALQFDLRQQRTSKLLTAKPLVSSSGILCSPSHSR